VGGADEDEPMTLDRGGACQAEMMELAASSSDFLEGLDDIGT
jgi:hypothetical protein